MKAAAPARWSSSREKADGSLRGSSTATGLGIFAGCSRRYRQKIPALALRSETQARDAFDLELLLRRKRGAVAPGQIEPEVIRLAADRVLDLLFEAFRDQVLPFLDPEVGELYDRSSWEQIQGFVVERLMELVR